MDIQTILKFKTTYREVKVVHPGITPDVGFPTSEEFFSPISDVMGKPSRGPHQSL